MEQSCWLGPPLQNCLGREKSIVHIIFFFFFFLSAASNKLLFIKEINEIIIEEGNKKIKTHY